MTITVTVITFIATITQHTEALKKMALTSTLHLGKMGTNKDE